MAYPRTRTQLESELRTLTRRLAARDRDAALAQHHEAAWCAEAGYGPLVGHSAPLRALRARVRDLAGRPAVLVVGPSGSGRTHAAVALHRAGPGGPLVVAPSEALELGSLAALAHGGTLVVDAPHALAAAFWAALSAVLDAADARVVVTTTAADALGPLQERLSTAVLQTPPLSACLEDLPAFARHFAGDQPLNTAFVAALQRRPWPGHLRQLRRVVQAGAAGGGWEPESTLEVPEVTTLEEVAALEVSVTARALARCGWQVYGPAGAARLLGLRPTTLVSRMQRMGLRRPD